MDLLMISGDRGLAAGERGPFYWLLEEYRRHWEHIHVVCPLVPEVGTTRPFDNVSLSTAGCGRLGHPRFAAAVARSLPAPPSLVVSHDYGLFRNGAAARLVRRELGIPWVSEIHHVDGHPRAATLRAHLQRRLTRIFVRRARPEVEAFRVVSQQVGDILGHWGIPSGKLLHLSSLYLDLELFSPGAAEGRDVDVLFCGRLEPEKGPRLLVDALAELASRRPGFRAVVVGRGTEQAPFLRRVRRLGLEQLVEHRTWLESRTELVDLYRRSKVLLCTSYSEGNPRVVAEAMACGAAVVSTPVGRVPELVEEGRNGRTCSWNAKELAAATGEILGDEQLRRAISERAPAAVATFERTAAIARMASVYREIARGAR